MRTNCYCSWPSFPYFGERFLAMDPVSVISIIEASGGALKACTTVTKTIIDFVDDVQNAQELTNDIRQEVQNSERVLKAVKGSFEQVDHHHPSLRIQQDVLEAVKGSVTDCDLSLKTLINILGYIRGADTKINVITNTQQALRLRNRRQELSKCRLDIERHKLSLNLSLTLVSL